MLASSLVFTGARATKGPVRRTVQCRAVVTADRADLDITKMEPLGDRVLVRPRLETDVSAGGVLISSSELRSNAEGYIGEVIKAGDEVKLSLKQGDMVLFVKQGFSEVETETGPIYFVYEQSILATLDRH